MKSEDVKCSTCGITHHEWVMFETNTGRRKQYQCPKCYLKGQSESGKFTFGRVQTYRRHRSE